MAAQAALFGKADSHGRIGGVRPAHPISFAISIQFSGRLAYFARDRLGVSP
jgi:hypothetical protein